MYIVTNVITNGYRRYWEPPNQDLTTLFVLLQTESLQDRLIKHTIQDMSQGFYKFLGNFERVSYAFNITTNDIQLIVKLTSLIHSNKIKARKELHNERNAICKTNVCV